MTKSSAEVTRDVQQPRTFELTRPTPTARTSSFNAHIWGAAQGDGGSITLLALFAGVALLFTTRYPRGIFDLVVGLNRWVFRVAAYAALMTDAYPPFRLDQGGPDPGSTAAEVRESSVTQR
jgi:hypothetical protein